MVPSGVDHLMLRVTTQPNCSCTMKSVERTAMQRGYVLYFKPNTPEFMGVAQDKYINQTSKVYMYTQSK